MSYSYVPRIKKTNSVTYFNPSGGVNAVDAGPLDLKNVRGSVTIIIRADDDPALLSASFTVRGGFGEWPDQYTQNWYNIKGGEYNCTVTSPSINTIIVDTVLAGFGGTDRQYTFTFYASQSVAPKVQSTGAAIGNNVLQINMIKYINSGNY